MNCEKFMLTEENIKKFLPVDESNVNNNEIKNNKKTIDKKTTDKKPYKKTKLMEIDNDKLFWCFYIMIHGEHDYEINNSFKREKEFKIECIEKLRKNKTNLRSYKLKLTKIEDELLNCKKIGSQALLAMCLLYKKNLIYVWDRKYHEFICNGEEEINIITSENNSISHSVDQEKVNFYRENYWQILNIDKPFKSITGYSRDDLVAIAKKLCITDTDKKKKKELYQLILERDSVPFKP